MLIAIVQESTTNTLTKLVAFENLDVFVGTNFLSLFEISGYARGSEPIDSVTISMLPRAGITKS